MLPDILVVMAWVAVGAIVIFLAILLFRALRSAPDATTSAHVLSRQQVRQAMEAGDALAMGTDGWMDEAQRLTAEQDFRAVYRALYLALLSGLHTAGKIDHNHNRTNWVYVQRYRGPAPERVRFAELTELFDRVWYGHKGGVGNDLEQLRLDISLLTATGPA